MTTEDLKPFCSTDKTRPGICEPWSDDRYTYATDGRVLLRVEKIEGVGPHDGTPNNMNMEKLGFPVYISDLKWVPLPSDIPGPEAVACSMCNNSGFHYCQCGHEHQCEWCKGEGEIHMTVKMMIEYRKFDAEYIRKLAKLPALRVASKFGDRSAALPFSFDGGIGLLMPMKHFV